MKSRISLFCRKYLRDQEGKYHAFYTGYNQRDYPNRENRHRYDACGQRGSETLDETQDTVKFALAAGI